MFERNEWRRIYRKKGISVDKGRKKTRVRKFRDYITYFIRKEESKGKKGKQVKKRSRKTH
jgi:hypothetical protein